MKLPHWPAPLWHEPKSDALSRMRALLQAIGNPHHHLPPVVHVAGTNGKGSTIAYLRYILEAAGYKVHCYVPPHIKEFNERILIYSEPVEEEPLFQAIETCRMAAEKTGLEVKFFEGTTVAAFLLFSQYPADILLLETGMGGRFDPTNVIDNPLLTIITSIYYDHTDFLGNTLKEIAWHKAGIMKKGAPCVTSFQQPEVQEALEQSAREVGIPLYAFGKHWVSQKTSTGMRFTDHHGAIDLPRPALRGDHQIINAGTAIATTTLLEAFTIPAEAIIAGLKNVYWIGRLEPITQGKVATLLPKGFELWFDGAHNESAGFALATVCDEWRDKPLYMITGTTRGKEIERFFAPLKGKLEMVCGVPVAAESNCYTAEEMREFAVRAGHNAIASGSVAEAVAHFAAHVAPPARILVCGSLYLRTEV